jgi:hypothetical protein
MAKHRRTDQEAAVALDQVLLELFAGQLLLEPAEAKRPGEPGVRPAAARSPKAKSSRKGKGEAG